VDSLERWWCWKWYVLISSLELLLHSKVSMARQGMKHCGTLCRVVRTAWPAWHAVSVLQDAFGRGMVQ
jgi:hypothetical protein